jgi:hypothetical protein
VKKGGGKYSIENPQIKISDNNEESTNYVIIIFLLTFVERIKNNKH